MITDIEEGDMNKSMHVQQVIVSVIHCVNEGLQQSQAMDWMSICTVPHLIAVDCATNLSTRWDDSKICIWTDPKLLSMEEV